MEIVQPPTNNQPLSRVHSTLLPLLNKRIIIQSKTFNLIGILFLSSLSINITAASALGQLPTLEPINTPNTVQQGSVDESTVSLETYTLGPGDEIRVDILAENELFADPIDQIVLLDGSLTLPWIGKVDVAGLNPIQAEI